MRIGLCRGLVLVAALAAAGCGSSNGGGAAVNQDGPSAKQALEDLAALLKSVGEENKPPPARLSDLESHEGVFLSATLGIQRKEIVYQWGTSLSGGSGIVAYEKDTESAGGWVLTQGGDVKKMTAEEFKAAPKAAKK